MNIWLSLLKAVGLQPIKASYDAAQDTDIMQRHYSAADSLSAVSANDYTIRRKLRERSRYACANNAYLRGMIDTLADYTVGEGATLQLTYAGEAIDSEARRDAARQVETLFTDWAYRVELWPKLYTMQNAIDQDGEAFALLTSDAPNLAKPVTLNFTLFECDYFDLPYGEVEDETATDAGIRVDAQGRPIEYYKLDEHPGSTRGYSMPTAGTWLSAEIVLHAFRKQRPGQLRGIPKTTSVLDASEQARRFRLAVVTAAETAADVAAVMYGDGEADWAEPAGGKWPYPRIEFERGAMVLAPVGARIEQIDAKQPVTTYDEYDKACVREQARGMGCPHSLALGTSADANFASGRLDLQQMDRAVEVQRRYVLEQLILDRLFEAWRDEALLMDGYLPQTYTDEAAEYEWGWRWPRSGHVDQLKEAQADTERLENGTATLKEIYSRKGQDYLPQMQQRVREQTEEQTLRTEAGLNGTTTNDRTREESTDSASSETQTVPAVAD